MLIIVSQNEPAVIHKLARPWPLRAELAAEALGPTISKLYA